jgi:hypothetical protein
MAGDSVAGFGAAGASGRVNCELIGNAAGFLWRPDQGMAKLTS